MGCAGEGVDDRDDRLQSLRPSSRAVDPKLKLYENVRTQELRGMNETDVLADLKSKKVVSVGLRRRDEKDIRLGSISSAPTRMIPCPRSTLIDTDASPSSIIALFA